MACSISQISIWEETHASFTKFNLSCLVYPLLFEKRVANYLGTFSTWVKTISIMNTNLHGLKASKLENLVHIL